MEQFLKPFLEKSGTYALRKLPVYTDGTVESNIKVFQKVIFKHHALGEFKAALQSVCSPETLSVNNEFVKKLVKCLSDLMSSEEDVKVKTEIFSYVFQSFVASCKGDDDVHIMQFFVVLSIVLGMNAIPNENINEVVDVSGCLINLENFKNVFQVEVSSCSPESFIIFKELLLCLSKTSVNLNAPEVQSHNKWLQQLLKNLAHSQPFQSIFFEIFLIVAGMDLKLFEGNLDYIFSNILVHRTPNDKIFSESLGRFLESALNICAKFQRSLLVELNRDDLVGEKIRKCLEKCTKSFDRQKQFKKIFNKFLHRFLTSIKNTPSVLVKEIILPSNVINEFSKTVRTASNQQCLSLFSILVENIGECFNNISENGSEFKLLLLVTSELLVCFLKEVKLYAPSIVSSTLQSFIAKLCTLKGSLQNFGNYLFSSKGYILKNKDIVEVYLALCFYCGEIQELVNCYRDSILQPSGMWEPNGDCDWQCCISLEQWEKLVNLVLKSKLECSCRKICFQLALQHLRISKLECKTVNNPEPTLKVIIHELTSECGTFNLFQQLPPEDFSVLTEFLTKEQSKLISKHILKQILDSENKEESERWVSHPALQENPDFTAALFAQVLHETGSILRSIVPEKNHARLSWLSDECLVEGAELQLPEKINGLLRNAKKMRKSVKEEEKKALIRLVEVFKLLPLPHMKDEQRKLGLSFIVGVGTFLSGEENPVFDSICHFLGSDMDASTCFDIGLCIKWLAEVSGESELKVKAIESLVRNSPNMKFGLSQMGEMLESTETSKNTDPLKMLETRVVLYSELGKCWQRAKKRKSDNDLIGSYRAKLAKMISEEAKQLEDNTINSENSKILLKIAAIELNRAIRGNEEEEIANLTQQKFPQYFEFALSSLKKEFDEASAAFLTFVLQSLPQLRKFLPQDSFMKMWKALKSHEKVNWRLFCSHSTEEEFREVLDDLLKISKKFLSSQSSKHSSNCFEIWVSFFESSTESKRNLCQIQLQDLFKHIHECHLLLRDLQIKRKYSLMKFFSFCLTNKEVSITSHVLDTIIHVILECLDAGILSTEEFHSLFTLEAEVASAVLLRQFVWSRSKVHLTFVIFKRLLSSLMSRCSTEEPISNEDVIKLSACAFCLEKWCSVMVKKEKDFARTSAYFITALVSSIASVTVPPPVKFHLVNSINQFLSISDSHTVAYLMRILRPGYQQVFNTVYNQFKKYHKYSGKI